jgi:hypothetical protein
MTGTEAERSQRKRGRKSASETRATEIRAKLISWKQTPEPHRISLRALAVRLATSHQLLSAYLKGLRDWQKKDYQRRAKAIGKRAKAEKRYMTPWEQSEVASLERAAFHCMIDSALTSTLKRYLAEFREKKRVGLKRPELKLITTLAQRGFPMAQKLLEKHQINLPQGSKE